MPKPPISMFLQPIVLIGHRTSGKTTLGREAARRLNLHFIDLDEVIASASGQTCEALVAADEAAFRALEQAHLEELLGMPRDQPPIIALGAGCRHLPPGPTYIWIDREDWSSTAMNQRRRLCPQMSFSEEVRWMQQSREPRWHQAATLKFKIPAGRSIDRAARDLETHIQWLASLGDSPLARRTWLVPTGPDDLLRPPVHASLHRFAGIELRSDYFPSRPELQGDPQILASLRTHNAAWLEDFTDAMVWDVDINFLDSLLSSFLLLEGYDGAFILSHHPDEPSRASLDALLDASARLCDALPSLRDRLILKYAPSIADWSELSLALENHKLLLATGQGVTFLPRGDDFHWIRPLLAARGNETNYLPLGLNDEPPIPGLDFWLPHLAGPVPNLFDALLGDPVATSQGDLWHRRRSIESEESTGYLKIRRSPCEPEELDRCLELLHDLNLRGLSITAPPKTDIIESAFVKNPEALPSANTLKRTDEGWLATDTDQLGMLACLEFIKAQGVQPGPVALFGRGGVSAAIRRAIGEAEGWELVHHAGAREGWIDPPEHVQLVINAAGPVSTVLEDIPSTAAFLDLHYTNVARGPLAPGLANTLHLQGDLFFEAQADAQRAFWISQSLGPRSGCQTTGQTRNNHARQ